MKHFKESSKPDEKRHAISINGEHYDVSPREALNLMCYTSDLTPDGYVYTISDMRFPDWNGVRVDCFMEQGVGHFSWVKEE